MMDTSDADWMFNWMLGWRKKVFYILTLIHFVEKRVKDICDVTLGTNASTQVGDNISSLQLLAERSDSAPFLPSSKRAEGASSLSRNLKAIFFR